MLTFLANTILVLAIGAEPSLRYATVFEESTGDKPRATSIAEHELVRILLERGFAFVDEAQSRKIRSVTDAGALMKSGISPVITSLDADMIIAGACRLAPVKNDLFGESIHRFTAAVEAKVIAVDNGRVVAAIAVRADGMGYDSETALGTAAKAVAKLVAAEIAEKAPKERTLRRYELSIAGLPDIAAGERVIAALGRVGQITKVDVRTQAKDATKLEIESVAGTARELAVAIDAASDTGGLAIVGYSNQTIKGEYKTLKTANASVSIRAFARAGDEAHPRIRALEETVGAGLAGAGLEISKDADGKMELRGTYRTSKDGVQIHVEIASGSKVLAKADKPCPIAQVDACGAALGRTLGEALVTKLSNVASKDVGEKRPLAIAKLEAENVFPARLATYADRPIAHVVLENTGKSRLADVVVSVQLSGLMKTPLSSPGFDLDPKTRKDLPLKVVLDRDALASHHENEPAVLDVVVEYTLGEYRLRESRHTGLVVYGLNALDWRDPSSIASFVAPHAPEVQQLARAAAGAVSAESKGEPLALPIALFEAIAQLELRYIADPVTPAGSGALDFVQYPSQTVAGGGGDCDDLSVLYAALGEAIGLPMLIVTTPGHVFPAAPTGLSADAPNALSSERKDLLVFRGQLFVPIETTKIGASFDEAWRSAALEIARWKGAKTKLEIVDVREAWKRFPPANLATATQPMRAIEVKGVAEAVDRALLRLKEERSSAALKTLARIDEDLLRAKTASEKRALELDKAIVLFELGRAKDARALLEALAESNPSDPIALNDLGNLMMLDDQARDAQKLYRRAIEHAKGDSLVKIRLNAALAAFVLKDNAEFGALIAKCLEAGATDAVAALAGQGQAVGGGGARGSELREVFVRDLDVALRRVLESQAPKGVMGEVLGQTAGSETGEARPLQTLLHWLTLAR